MTLPQLLAASTAINDELRLRGHVRTSTSVAGELMESAVARLCGGTLLPPGTKSVDVLTTDGRGIQVKTRCLPAGDLRFWSFEDLNFDEAVVAAMDRVGAVAQPYRSHRTGQSCEQGLADSDGAGKRYRNRHHRRPAVGVRGVRSVTPEALAAWAAAVLAAASLAVSIHATRRSNRAVAVTERDEARRLERSEVEWSQDVEDRTFVLRNTGADAATNVRVRTRFRTQSGVRELDDGAAGTRRNQGAARGRSSGRNDFV